MPLQAPGSTPEMESALAMEVRPQQYRVVNSLRWRDAASNSTSNTIRFLEKCTRLERPRIWRFETVYPLMLGNNEARMFPAHTFRHPHRKVAHSVTLKIKIMLKGGCRFVVWGERFIVCSKLFNTFPFSECDSDRVD